ncbi:uncharacterized protein LOC126907335 [Daktulosphaira vitifoliae]|uniref:uncharacterized protein LOC126907335 n=1 Tax=Daktulosphaira vitifoliae TaxID=58002 RepID=UPI0021AAD213|nr:uncharacterized protein LOC126907335 [Daktulosphaira vitifoliae]
MYFKYIVTILALYIFPETLGSENNDGIDTRTINECITLFEIKSNNYEFPDNRITPVIHNSRDVIEKTYKNINKKIERLLNLYEIKNTFELKVEESLPKQMDDFLIFFTSQNKNELFRKTTPRLTRSMVTDLIKLFNKCKKNKNGYFNTCDMKIYIDNLSVKDLMVALNKANIDDRLKNTFLDNFNIFTSITKKLEVNNGQLLEIVLKTF